MANSITDIIQNVLRETLSGNIVWHEIENTYCLKSDYKNKRIVICRYPDETGKRIASFNYLNEEDNIIEPFHDWDENEEGYRIISELYDTACKATPTACE